MNTRYENAYVLNILGEDHPGIVAAVSGAVTQLGGNIDACSQTVQSGYFTQILVVSFPQPAAMDVLSASIRAADAALQVVAQDYRLSKPSATEAADIFVITAFGKDKPGIIHRFSQYLSSKDINIIDLYWDRRSDDFVLISQVQINRQWDIGMLQADLEQIGVEDGFHVKLQHENVFVATNQLRLAPPPGGA